jgi:hypothetical protein
MNPALTVTSEMKNSPCLETMLAVFLPPFLGF